jgi:hypothetical protein
LCGAFWLLECFESEKIRCVLSDFFLGASKLFLSEGVFVKRFLFLFCAHKAKKRLCAVCTFDVNTDDVDGWLQKKSRMVVR